MLDKLSNLSNNIMDWNLYEFLDFVHVKLKYSHNCQCVGSYTQRGNIIFLLNSLQEKE